ncbi:MAG: lipid-A-disaccharide synthase [Desulfomonilaceae bacterium]|nr:lipid-A-disaccharide synthase [Desulfomonilaceae bacterium]
MKQYSILMLAGEASGDHHAAAMLRDLKEYLPDVRVTGIGGDKLAAAGMRLLHHYREVNTIGLSEGLGKARNIYNAYRTMKRELMAGGHDLFIPVDFPDVNLRLCRFAKEAGVKVCYYISPQVWAWRKGRIRKIAARVDRMMTIFPFEAETYREAGVQADFVGHTMVRDIPPDWDKTELRSELGIDPESHVIAVVPGSRPAEISRMLPVMCDAVKIYLGRHPDTRILLPLAGAHLSGLVEDIIHAHHVKISVRSEEAPQIMAASDGGLVTSGTATLQAALVGMPHAVVYKLDRFTWFFALRVLKPLVMDKDLHVAMANVLAINSDKEGWGPLKEMLDAGIRIPCRECGRPLFVPELLQDDATPENLAGWLERFSSDHVLISAMKRGFRQLRAMLSPRSAGGTAAEIVVNCLQGR